MKEYYEQFRVELLDSCVPFWLAHGQDTQYGGLLNCLDREGQVYSDDKSVWMQGRAGWMFSYIYNHIDKKEEYLALAKSCIDFATKYCIDGDGLDLGGVRAPLANLFPEDLTIAEQVAKKIDNAVAAYVD